MGETKSSSEHLVKSQDSKKLVVIPPDEKRVKFGEARAVEPISQVKSMPNPTWKLIAGLILVSLLLHLGSMINLSWLGQRQRGTDMVLKKPQPLRVSIKAIKKVDPVKKEEDEELENTKLVETKMTPTEKPKVISRLGAQDHATDKETKKIQKPNTVKAADAGEKGTTTLKQGKETAKTPDKEVEKASSQSKTPVMKLQSGTLSFGKTQDPKPRNAYESMLPTGSADLPGQMNAGYQEYIDDKVDVGDRIDLNTTNYRYIGYFSSVRKEIEMVWVYPAEAVRRGMEGETKIEFRIEKDGTVSRVRIVKSSGFEILDKATLETLRLASPLTPLPDGLGKERLIVTAAFRYVLYGFAGGH